MRQLIKAAGSIDPESGVITEPAALLLENGRIQAVDKPSELEQAEAALEVMEFPTGYVLPGLINSHAHLCLPSGGVGLVENARQSNQTWRRNAETNARATLLNGVTTLRDCGDRDNIVRDLGRKIESRELPGPRLLQCGPPLTVTNGHCLSPGGEADGVEGLIRATRQRFEAGADFIKVMATGGGIPGTHPELAAYSAEEIGAMVRTAHELGRKVTAHCRGIPGIENAVRAGVDHIEHCCFELPGSVLRFEPHLADAMADRGIVVTPTIRLYLDSVRLMERRQKESGLTDDEQAWLDSLRACVEEKLCSLYGLRKAGVTVVAGNDAGLAQTGHTAFWQELEMMEQGGMNSLEVLRSATSVAARVLDQADSLGGMAPGMKADLLVVEGNPLQNLSRLNQVLAVFKDGCRYQA
jgi:imidazolonepropionase-like amidohydrolase